MSPLEKVDARDRVVDALRTHDYSGKTRVVRVNGVTTRWCLGDVTAVVGGAGDRLDCMMVPKVEDAGQLHFIDHLLTQLETEHELAHRIGIEAQIENARGAMNIREIAQATPRLETLIFGPGDYAANMGVGQLVIGSIDPEYPGDQWHWVLSQIVTAARAYGLQAIDGPYTDIKDTDGYRRLCRRARLVGYDGKWVLHPGPGRDRQRGVLAVAGRVRRGPAAARRLPARHPGRAQGRGHARGPDDRRGLAQDRRAGGRPRRGGRHGAGRRRRHEPAAGGADRRAAGDRRAGPPVHRRADHPGGIAARARRRLPRRDRRGAARSWASSASRSPRSTAGWAST